MPRLILILALAVLLPTSAVGQSTKKSKTSPAPLQAEAEKDGDKIYSWVDGRGGWHFVDSIQLVPPRYQAQARANAMRARSASNKKAQASRGAATAGTTSVAKPPATRTTSPTQTATSAPMTDGERTMKIRQLQRKVMKLEAELAALEEGNAPEAYLETVDNEDELTDEKLGELLSETEKSLADAEAELAALQGG
ncbi:MAG: hypothetical protein KDA24_11200 [Deltaproteobacteria bacterium]|nr:hypothetical protein [Deltaproteobacteria bacterium]